MKFRLHIYSRLCITIATFLLSFFAQGIVLIVTYILLLILITISDSLKEHLRLLLIGMLPVYLSFVFIYIVVNNQFESWEMINLKTINILLITTAFQVLLVFPPNEFFHNLRMVGIKGNLLIIIISSYTLIDDIKKRADKIINARLSRGYVNRRTRFNMMRQLPYVLRPLFIQIFRSSTERAISWEQKDMISLVQKFEKPVYYSEKYNIIIVVCYLFWVLLSSGSVTFLLC